VLVVPLFLSVNLYGQTVSPVDSLVLNLDYARFSHDDVSGYLEIYYGFYPKLLTYEYSDGKYRGGINLSTRLLREGSNEAVVERSVPLQIAETDTTGVWYGYSFDTQAGFSVPFGKYVLEAVAADSLAPSRRDSVRLPIQISAFSSEVSISDLEFCKNIKASQESQDLFFKNSLQVVPNPSLVFGIATSPVLFYYCELYNVEPDESYIFKMSVLDNQGKVLRERTKSRRYASSNALEVGTTTVTSYPSGNYHLRCQILDSDSTELAATEKWFLVYSPHLQSSGGPTLAQLTKDLNALNGEELSKEFEVARYVATEDEIEMFSQIETESGKRDFLATFWAAVGQGRLERPPIGRDEYLSRVEAATEKFTAFGKEGWLTDRGRVYVLYGKPDEIERSPSSLGGSKAYEVWRYYSIEDGVEFVFVNRTGYGEYQLVHSTKRGELRDDLWDRFLQ
jgi:GWxTD domain-containing protein